MKHPTFEIGDVVEVIDDDTFKRLKHPPVDPGYVGDMPDYCGMVTVITKSMNDFYMIEGIPYWWSPYWLKRVENTVDDTVLQTFDSLL